MKKIRNLFKKTLGFITNHKISSIAIIIILIIAGTILRPKTAAPIDTQTIGFGNITQTVSITGAVTSKTSADLKFPSAGKLSYVGANLGDQVFQGQIIASLDTTDLQASLRQYQQDFNAAKAIVEKVYNDTGRVPDLTFDQKITQTAAEATQNKAYDNIVKTRNSLANASLVSPIAGALISAPQTTVGANVSITDTYTVADDKNLIFKMDVDEGDIGKVQIGQSVNIILNAFPNKTISSVVSSIDSASHTTSTGGNAYTVKTDPLTNVNFYRIGMNGDADIVIDQKNNVLTISNSAIFDNDKVYVKKGNNFIKKTIAIGLQNDTDSQVLNGLSEGDIVALQPSSVKAQ